MSQNRNGELEDLKKKSQQGIETVAVTLLKNREIQQVIGKAVLRQSFESGVFLAFILAGLLNLLNTLKETFGVTWQMDAILIGTGMLYFYLKTLKTAKTNKR